MTDKKEVSPVIKAIKGFFPYFLTPAMLVFIIWNYATDKANNKQVQFDSPKDKIETKQHIESAPNEVDNYKAYQELRDMKEVDSLNSVDAIRSRKERDSLFKLQATTIYQMKETQNTILEKLEQ